MKVSGSSPWLLGAASVLAAAILGVVGWGQVRRVSVPRSAEWPHTVSLCPDLAVDDETYAAVVALLQEHHLPIRPEGGPCNGRAAIHLRVSVADVERVYPSSEAMGEWAQISGRSAAGAFERVVVGAVITDCTVWLRSPTDELALVHEVLHCLGYDHPQNAPTGHVMSRDYARSSLEDWRGIP